MNAEELVRRAREIEQNTIDQLNPRSPAEMQARWNGATLRELHREQGKNLVDVITARVKSLQDGLQPGEVLAVYCDTGSERITVSGIEFPTWNIAVIVGTDENGNATYRLEAVQDVKLTCKVLASTSKRNPIGFKLPE